MLLYNTINSNISYPYLLGKIDLHVPLKSTWSAKIFHQTLDRTNYGYNVDLTEHTPWFLGCSLHGRRAFGSTAKS